VIPVMKMVSNTCRRARLSTFNLITDRSGVAAIEFAMIVPIMLVMFFGTVEVSSGVAADRKITLAARALSDLTSQFPASVADSDLQNIFAASSSILTPYSVTPTQPTISEVYVDASKVAKIQWSKAATIALVSGAPKATLQTSTRTKGDVVTTAIPPGLLISGTYLIWSEIDYRYVPAVGYIMAKAGVLLHEATFTRPRQSACVDYPLPVAPALPCTPVP
jgi:Flp pilus assembly protein TadG